MNAPRLGRLVSLEQSTDVSDGAGGFDTNWTQVGQLWAEISLRSGRALNGVSQSRYRVVVRAAPSGSTMRPKPGQRFRDGNRFFLIDAVSEQDPQGRFLRCFATEEVVA
ncbi:MAG: head-tail adaptor protein [Thalassovita sp.]